MQHRNIKISGCFVLRHIKSQKLSCEQIGCEIGQFLRPNFAACYNAAQSDKVFKTAGNQRKRELDLKAIFRIGLGRRGPLQIRAKKARIIFVVVFLSFFVS